jgi:hypothetical protein
MTDHFNQQGIANISDNRDDRAVSGVVEWGCHWSNLG